MYAADRGYVEIAKMLIGGSADPNLQTQDGWTALSIAAWNGHADIANMLKNAGAH